MALISHNPFRVLAITMLGISAALPVVASAQSTTSAFHFESICRSDPAVNKNTVTVRLHGPDTLDPTGTYYIQSHAPLVGTTINALWTYVDYRQNHAVFKYNQASCTTDANGECTFRGGSGRARWQLNEVVGYDMSTPAFDTVPTATCPNTTMIDFW